MDKYKVIHVQSNTMLGLLQGEDNKAVFNSIHDVEVPPSGIRYRVTDLTDIDPNTVPEITFSGKNITVYCQHLGA